MPKSILVVDDSIVSRMMIRSILKEAHPGINIVEAENGQDALNKVNAFEHFDLALVDFHLPGIDGLELFSQLADKIDIPRKALLTANVQDEIKQRTESQGIIYINKPIDEVVIRKFVADQVEAVDQLSELEMDALREIFNIGFSRAAAVLHKMVSQPVELTIPEIKLLRNEEIKSRIKIKDSEAISAVTQSFSGDYSGNAMLMFSRSSGLLLVRRLLGDAIPLDKLSELEQDSLVEIGNVVLNACFGTVINILKADITIGMPKFVQGSVGEVFRFSSEKDWALFIEINISMPDDKIEGSISFLMDINSFELFKRSVRAFVLSI